jgi:hypothetical protein
MMDSYAWGVMLVLSASIIPAVEAAKVLQRSRLLRNL